jgi:hypothetical protein
VTQLVFFNGTPVSWGKPFGNGKGSNARERRRSAASWHGIRSRAGMPNAAFDPLIQAFFSQLAPFLIVAGLLGMLLGGLTRWIDRGAVRAFRSRVGALKLVSAQSSSSLYRQSEDVPYCPACDAPMVRRSVQRGPRAGKPFWGCSNYPMCRIKRPLLASNRRPNYWTKEPKARGTGFKS